MSAEDDAADLAQIEIHRREAQLAECDAECLELYMQRRQAEEAHGFGSSPSLDDQLREAQMTRMAVYNSLDYLVNELRKNHPVRYQNQFSYKYPYDDEDEE